MRALMLASTRLHSLGGSPRARHASVPSVRAVWRETASYDDFTDEEVDGMSALGGLPSIPASV